MISIRRDVKIEEIWSEFKECFKSLCLKCLALNENDEWLNIMLTGFLSAKDVDSIRNVVQQEYNQLEKLGVTKLRRLLLTFDVKDATEFLEVVKNILSGSIEIRGQVIKLGEEIDGYIQAHSNLISQEPYDFPRISFIASGKSKVKTKDLSKVEEELKSLGYTSLDELGLQWLMLPSLKSFTVDAILDIPIYFLPLSLNLEENTVRFSGICHKSLAPKLRVRLTLKKKYAGRDYVPVENYSLGLHMTPTSNDFGTATAYQILSSTLSGDDLVECVVASKIGIVGWTRRTVEGLLPKETLISDFPELVKQFVNLDEIEALLLGDKQVGGELRKPQLSFQRSVAWLLSMLGFQVIELEGTKYNEIEEINGTRREIDMLMFDSKTKKMFVIDLTLRVPKDEKIDDVANLQNSLQRRGLFVEPMIIVRDYASETKKNRRHVKIIDREDLQNIVNKLRMGNIEEAKKIIVT